MRVLPGLGLLLAAVCGGVQSVPAQQAPAVESLLVELPDTAALRRHVRALAARAHVAGTPAQDATAEYVLREMAAAGLDTLRTTYEVFLPFQDSAVVERVRPTRRRLALAEPALAADPTTAQRPWPAMNGYSGHGDATAPLVFANYGLADDYAVLDSLGIAVAGRIVIAKYGRSFRGIKAREAERRGALGLILYSDPQDDGYVRGDVYPAGPMRHPDAPQRGSIFNGQGDPSTPGWASRPGVRRLPEDSMAISRIPVVPIGYANARVLLEPLQGPSVPQGWQGGLPFRYHVGGTPAVSVRVAVWRERGARAYKRIANTFGILPGRELPGELVFVGGHRDGWGPGATDNASGTAVVVEAARAWGAAVRQGHRPRRTLVFATWDAEEWGLVGSSEFAEELADSLRAHAVAYLNLDVAASGRVFGASGTASLHGFIRAATQRVPHPDGGGTIYDAWRRQRALPAGEEPPLGDLGGGSDFAGFYNHLGIPSFAFGFGGAGGVYHSAYDTWTFLERFADPGYAGHRAATQLAALMLSRLADAAVLPLDYGAFGRYLRPHVQRLAREAEARGLSADFPGLERALAALAAAGDSLRDALRAEPAPTATGATTANALLRQVEQQLTRPAGLDGRPFQRNLVFASDRDNGYADVALPAIAEALRDADPARTTAAVAELVSRLDLAAEQVARARRALGAP